MNKTGLSISLVLGFALLMGLSDASYAAQSVDNDTVASNTFSAYVHNLRSVIEDTLITAAVKADLAKDVRLGTLIGIEVNTIQGVVTLAGKVHTSDEKTLVEQNVREVKGVLKVNNELQIVTPRQKG